MPGPLSGRRGPGNQSREVGAPCSRGPCSEEGTDRTVLRRSWLLVKAFDEDGGLEVGRFDRSTGAAEGVRREHGGHNDHRGRD
jgi:hypothetical protein